MSTKSTLAHGPNFHLYHEVFDDDNVYLEVSGVAFEATPDRVMMPVPLVVWEFVRRFSTSSFEHVSQNNEELRAFVEEVVDERIRKHALAKTLREKAVVSGMGSLIFGGADEPREVQLETALKHFWQLRNRQRAVQRALEELEELNRRG